MITFNQWISGALLCALSLGANAGNEKADIKVMTQNQYLGADLGPIIAAGTPEEYGAAIAGALQEIAANNIPERSRALAESIADRKPHLVALQEVFEFGCVENIPGTCNLFQGVFNDHLALTETALDNLGADYRVAAQVQNMTIPSEAMQMMGLPGLPVYFPNVPVPAFFVTVVDRDVILARGDIATTVTPYPCSKPSLDGCNFLNVATIDSLAGPITVERGFVGVDAIVKSENYRFVNTHLEVRILGGEPLTAALQSAQASQLSYTLALLPPAPGARFILAGDINSAPTHDLIGPILPPYKQFAEGLDFLNRPAFAPMVDAWTLRPGNPDGFTCCEAADLRNPDSQHDERIDVVFARPAPASVKANVMDSEASNRTASGLWPSDHASVIAELTY